MTAITAAGFIIADETAIWGVGATEAEAWADFRAEMHKAGILPTDEVGEDDENYDEDDFEAIEASSALLSMVKERGGAIAWGKINGVACTIEEENKAIDDEGDDE